MLPQLQDLIPVLHGTAWGAMPVNIDKDHAVRRFPKVTVTSKVTADGLQAAKAEDCTIALMQLEGVLDAQPEAAAVVMGVAAEHVQTHRQGFILSPRSEATSAHSMVM